MKKFNFKKEVILWLILLLPILYLGYVWNALPGRVPIHFNASGVPNGWGPKASELILIIVNIFLYLLTPFLTKIDPKKLNDSFFTHNFYKMRVWLTFFLSLLSIATVYVALPGNEHYSIHWIPASVFLMIAVMGNFMINLKPNWFWGIRTPWTLSSDVVWKKTHQVGGRLWFYGGLICVAGDFLLTGIWLRVLTIGFIAIIILFSYAYSFWVFKQEQAKEGGKISAQ